MKIMSIVDKIIGKIGFPCICTEEYTGRGLSRHDCPKCQWGDHVKEVITDKLQNLNEVENALEFSIKFNSNRLKDCHGLMVKLKKALNILRGE